MIGELPPDFGEALAHVAGELFKRLMRHRERYLRAWVAQTGIHPSDAEILEFHDHAEGTITYSVRPRLAEMGYVVVLPSSKEPDKPVAWFQDGYAAEQWARYMYHHALVRPGRAP